MKVIYKPRQCGKTIEAIKMSAETDCYIVCHSQKECSRVFHMAKEMGINIRFPISFGEFLGGRYCARNIKGFIIDNADILLQYLTPVRVECVTLTDESKDLKLKCEMCGKFFIHPGRRSKKYCPVCEETAPKERYKEKRQEQYPPELLKQCHALYRQMDRGKITLNEYNAWRLEHGFAEYKPRSKSKIGERLQCK